MVIADSGKVVKMVLHELEAKRRDSIILQEQIDKNENVLQFLDRKLSDACEASKIKDDEKDSQQDGGWGWFVTFGAFVINMIVDGIVYTFGLFFIDLYEYYNESKSLTAWVGSVAVGTLLCSGKPEFIMYCHNEAIKMSDPAQELWFIKSTHT